MAPVAATFFAFLPQRPEHPQLCPPRQCLGLRRLWEYSCWGGPAFEIADFLVHAAHSEWPRQQTRRLANIYGECSNDTAIWERIAVYETLMLVWWTLRLGRILPEARSGRDKRLLTFSQSWLVDRQRLQKRYQNLAEAALANWKAVL